MGAGERLADFDIDNKVGAAALEKVCLAVASRVPLDPSLGVATPAVPATFVPPPALGPAATPASTAMSAADWAFLRYAQCMFEAMGFGRPGQQPNSAFFIAEKVIERGQGERRGPRKRGGLEG